MSIKVMSHVWDNSKQKGAALLLLLALADMADENGDCYPSTERLAKKARVDVRSAQRTIKRLIEDGELIVFEKQGMPGHTGQKTNLYRIVLTTIEAALTIPVPQRGGKSVTTNPRTFVIRRKVVTKVSPPVFPQGVVETPPDPIDPSVKDQKQKVVVVARDAFFHPVFLEVVQAPKSNPLLPSIPLIVPSSDNQVAAEIITFYTETFGVMPTPTLLDQVKDALKEFGAPIIREAMAEAKLSKPDGYVAWKYLDTIMKRKQRQAATAAPFTSPYWDAFKARWKELTTADLPEPTSVYLIKRYRETSEALKQLGAIEADVRALVDAKINEERYDYRFDYAATDIVAIVSARKIKRPAPPKRPILTAPTHAADETDTPEAKAAALAAARQQLRGVLR